jgi:hypothetical protein
MIPIPYLVEGQLQGWHVWTASKDRLINVYFVPLNYEELLLDEIGGLEDFNLPQTSLALTKSMKKKKSTKKKDKESRDDVMGSPKKKGMLVDIMLYSI